MRRLSSLVLALALSFCLLIGFSATANAELVQGYYIRQDTYIMADNGYIADEWFTTFRPHDDSIEREEHVFNTYYKNDIQSSSLFYRNVWNIFADSTFPFELNKVNKVTLENFYYAYLLQEVHSGSTTTHYVRDIGENDNIYTVIEYTDGTTETINLKYATDSDNSMDMQFQFTPTKNVSRFTVIIDSDLTSHIQSPYVACKVTTTTYLGEWRGDDKHDFNIDVQTEEAGLLSGILGWIQNIFNKIGDMFTELSNIGQTLLRLPQELWSRISEGLKALFIPSDADISSFSDRMSTLMETKLGAVYQAGTIISDVFSRISASDESNTIDLPVATIPLPEDNEFSFGGYSVAIVPDGFEFLATAVKTVLGVVATLGFVNGLRKKYDEVIGGNT